MRAPNTATRLLSHPTTANKNRVAVARRAGRRAAVSAGATDSSRMLVVVVVAIGALLRLAREAEAVFADRSALQTALFECVGACPIELEGSVDETYCSAVWSLWQSGTGADCNAASTHGAIQVWDVSRVTSMRNMFYYARAFNQPLSSWNVARVMTMSSMFANTNVFNQDLSSWNVGRVTDMRKSE